MPRNILVIILLILTLFALGTTTFHLILKEKSERMEKEERIATLPEDSQTKKVSPEPEKIVTQPQEPSTTEAIDTSDWKVYRNEEYGFEIKYPSIGWKLQEVSPMEPTTLFRLCEQDKRGFCIYGRIASLFSECFVNPWKVILDDIYHCSDGMIYFMHLEKRIITNSGVEGYKVQGLLAGGYYIMGVFFPLQRESNITRPVLLIYYYLENYINTLSGPQELEIFDQIISSFRLIK